MMPFISRVVFFVLILGVNLCASEPKIHYYTYSNKAHPGLDKLLKSARHFKIPLKVLGIPYPTYQGPPLPFDGYLCKLKALLEELNKGEISDSDIVLFTDAFDTFFIAGGEVILRKFLAFGVPIVMGAEKNCFPLKDREGDFPKSPSSFKFVNCGFYIGYCKEVRDALHSVLTMRCPMGVSSGDFSNDQTRFILYYLSPENRTLHLDTTTQLVLNTYSVGKEEVKFSKKAPHLMVRETKNHPCVIHFNGSGAFMGELAFIYNNLFIIGL